MHGSAHIWTAAAYYIIGAVLIAVAWKVWWTHPLNRVFLFGEYVTPAGVSLVMRHWPMVALFGAFIFSCAVDHHVEWLMMHGRPGLAPALKFFSVVEAVISWVTALSVLLIGGRALVRSKWRR